MMLLNFAQEAGLKPVFAAQTHGGEYCSPCLKCGGTDRFRIQPNRKQKNCVGYFFCRHCKFSGDTIQFCREAFGLSYAEAVIRSEGTKKESVSALSLYKPEKKAFQPQPSKIPSETWHENASTFLAYAQQNLPAQVSTLEMLGRRAIHLGAVEQNMPGWNPETKHVPDWNGDQHKTIWIPKGLVIPLMLQGKLVGIKIRRDDFKDGDKIGKYIIIPGGAGGFSMYGDFKECTTLVVLESELDTMTLQSTKVKGCAFAAIGGNNKNPTLFVDHLAQKTLNLVIIPDNDDGGMVMATKWQQLYPHARIHKVPFGKDVGEAVQMGLDPREFLLAATNPLTCAVKSFESTHHAKALIADVPSVLEPKPVVVDVYVDEPKHETLVQNESALCQPNNSETGVSVNPRIPIAARHEATEQVHTASNDRPTEELVDDHDLFAQAVRYFQKIPESSRLPSDKKFLTELALGSDSARAQSGELQKDLRLALKIAHSVEHGLGLV